MIHVLIVEDSRTAALLLKSILESDPEVIVVGFAKDGEEGLRKTIELSPDIVTMDVHLPGMNGFQTTRLIMEKAPRPIVIITSSMAPKEVDLSFNALQAGALSILNKPSGPTSPNFQKESQEIISTIKLMAEVKVVSRFPRRNYPTTNSRIPGKSRGFDVIAIGASTGGPAAISALIAKLPRENQPPILIVQHISEGFDKGFSDWLQSTTDRVVRIAEDGMPLVPGTVFVGPKGKHLALKDPNCVNLIEDKNACSYSFCPSANVLFKSVGEQYGRKALGIILTGMGNDGVEGLRILKKLGGYVIAQDQASSVVFGMPKAAIDAGLADRVLPVEGIAPAITKLLEKEKE